MHSARLSPSSPRPFFSNKAALSQAGLVVGAHVLLLGGLLSYAPTRDAIVQIIHVVADLVPPKVIPPAPEPKPLVLPPPKREPLKVEPVRPPPKPTPPIPTPEKPPEKLSPAPSPAPVTVAPTPVFVAAPVPAAASAPTPSPTAAPSPTTVIPAQTSAATPPAPVTSPSYKAAYLSNPEPEYPVAARQLQESGRVILEVLVSAQGLAERVLVKISSGSSRLDNAALKAVRQWKFVPAKRGNEAISGIVNVPINFKYEDE